jgi:hypothetical protein
MPGRHASASHAEPGDVSALREQQPLHDVYTASHGAPDGRGRNLLPTIGRPTRSDLSVTKRPPHAQWVRPAGQLLWQLITHKGKPPPIRSPRRHIDRPPTPNELCQRPNPPIPQRHQPQRYRLVRRMPRRPRLIAQNHHRLPIRRRMRRPVRISIVRHLLRPRPIRTHLPDLHRPPTPVRVEINPPPIRSKIRIVADPRPRRQRPLLPALERNRKQVDRPMVRPGKHNSLPIRRPAMPVRSRMRRQHPRRPTPRRHNINPRLRSIRHRARNRQPPPVRRKPMAPIALDRRPHIQRHRRPTPNRNPKQLPILIEDQSLPIPRPVRSLKPRHRAINRGRNRTLPRPNRLKRTDQPRNHHRPSRRCSRSRRLLPAKPPVTKPNHTT